MPTLEDLRRVIRRIEGSRPPRPAPAPVEDALGGELVETDAGPVVIVRRAYPLDYAHGRLPLDAALTAPIALLARLARVEAAPVALRDVLFVDTETTGLAGGTGTYAFLVGAGRFVGERFEVTQYFMRDLDEEPALLAALAPRIAEASGLVTFNGAAFDLPLLETRFVLARRRWRTDVVHLDLLRPARRMWSAATDCRLATLEREVLGVRRSDDVPGSLIPTLYFDFLRTRRAAPLVRVLEHNRHDVLSLAALVGWLGAALEARLALGAAEIAGLGRLWEPVDAQRALACYRQALAAGLDGRLAQWARLRLAWWEKRAQRWEIACELWRAAARVDALDARPWEELAKFHEHRRRDFVAAREVVRTALELAAGRLSARVADGFAHRLRRLERRLAAPVGQ